MTETRSPAQSGGSGRLPLGVARAGYGFSGKPTVATASHVARGKYAMSVTASPARATASCAAATNERPAGNRRNSEVWDKNTRRGGLLAITTASQHSPNAKHQFPGGRRAALARQGASAIVCE